MSLLQAKVQNLSPMDREHWAVITFPRELVKDFNSECSFVTENGQTWRAVKGRSDGAKTVFRVRADIQGDEEVVGVLENSPIDDRRKSLTLHPWVTDDIWALIPSLSGLSAEWIIQPTLVESTNAHQRWHARQRIPSEGLIFEWWADVYDLDPVIRVRGKVVWSDRNDPEGNKSFAPGKLILSVGEIFSMEFKERRGITDNFLVDGKWCAALNTEPITLRDGAGIPVCFNLLCTGSMESLGNDDYAEKSANNLIAAGQGDVVGVFMGWDGHWTSNNNTPSEYENGGAALAAQRFAEDMAQPLGYFEPINYGIGKTPGQTGDQEDFAAAKGTYVVTYHELKMLDALKFVSEYELYRGINHYELDGSILTAENHPRWVTWSGKTHWHTGVSPDRLGKESNTGAGNGWQGYDDQHRSQNNLGAYMMLSDDPLIMNQLEHQKEIDRASYRIRFDSFGAPRAQGRLMGAWANFAVFDESWKEIMDIHATTIINNRKMNVSGPMKVLNSAGPDGRKRVYQNGELAKFVCLWEHGLAAVGLYNAWKATGNPKILEAVQKVGRLLLNYGWFTENGNSYMVGDIVWKGGEDVDLTLSNGWDERGSNPKTQEFLYGEGGGVLSWVFNGILVAREVLEVNDPELDEFINSRGFREGPSSRRESEWWCAVKR